MAAEALERLESFAQEGVLPSREELLAERCRRDFARFVQEGWRAVEPDAALVWEMPHQVMAEHIQELLLGWVRERLWQYAHGMPGHRLPRVPTSRLPTGRKEREAELHRRADLREKWAAGRRLGLVTEGGLVRRQPQLYRNLLINIGTGYGKSRLAHVFGPAWLWLWWPSAQVLAFSVNANGVVRDAGQAKALVTGPWYTGLFTPWWGLDRKKDGDPHYRNTARGERVARGWWAQVQGERGHLELVDDPEDPEEVYSDGERRKGQSRWDTTLERRVHAGGTSIRLATQQHLHPEDWSWHVLSTGEWEHLELPTVAESTPSPCTCPTHRRGHTALGWRDTRKPGELLAPRLVTAADVESRRKKPIIFAAQDQQRPQRLEGNIFHAPHWRYWRFADEDSVAELADRTLVLPPREEWGSYFERLILSGDLSFGLSGDGSRDAIGVWGKRGEKRVLLALRWAPMSFVDARKAIRALLAEVPGVGTKVLEQAANASAVGNSLGEQAMELGEEPISGLVLRPAAGGKVYRATSVQHLHVAGNLYLPLHHTQRQEMVDEASAFPKKGVRNDFVDQLSQALKELGEESGFFV